MADLLWHVVALPALVSVVLSFVLERLLQPTTLPVWRRDPAGWAIHVGLCLLVFVFELAIFRRPWFAAAVMLAFMLLIVLVNNAKFHSLREPFVFQDFEYFTDAIKHPRLYLPFLGVWRAAAAIAGFVGAVWAGLLLEPSLTAHIALAGFTMMVAALLLLAIALIWLGALKRLQVGFDPAADLYRLGLLSSLWCYAQAERAPVVVPASPFDTVPPVALRLPRPNLVVVQSESFFDARRLFDGIRPNVLQHFDQLKASAVLHGQVDVAAWGANTVRTEFAFLSGLDGDALGVHRFNPYRKLARQGIPTLASALRSLGYRTVCVHPYHGSFYARDVVLPLLGFDQLIDIRSFDGVAKTGPYVGDVALAEYVCDLLQPHSPQPLFVFVITMENHGPLHLEQVGPTDVASLYTTPPPTGCDDLTIYLRHLRNADQMAALLRDRLAALPGEHLLCWYGDHVPIMPAVYDTLGTPAGQTDYLIWKSGGQGGRSDARSIQVQALAAVLLQEIGAA